MHHVHSWARTKAYGPSIYFPEKHKRGSISLEKRNTVAQTATPISPNVNNELHSEKKVQEKKGFVHVFQSCRSIVFSSYLNILLLFVPAGIVAKFTNLDPGIVFGLNAVAIIPLAGMLSHATESVAQQMGDTVGALMNVTFGNAVELIIFIIALQKDEIRIVQASLLGSILANLLLILGMCFLVGGLRYLEQLYNSKVTKLSACLLSLSVMSLLLPTAFHASFNDSQEEKAESAVLKVSRGTSVVLLIVYGMYLLFQLKSHAYMYKSTPQHIIDEEAAPGPVAAWIEHVSVNVSPSDSDSDVSHISHLTTTTKRLKKATLRRSSGRKSSILSNSLFDALHNPLQKKHSSSTLTISPYDHESDPNSRIAEVSSNLEDHPNPPSPKLRRVSIVDFDDRRQSHPRTKRKKSKQRSAYTKSKNSNNVSNEPERSNLQETVQDKEPESTNYISTKDESQIARNLPEENSGPKRPFNLRIITLPHIPKSLTQNVFTQPLSEVDALKTDVVPNIRYGVRRTNSLPNNLSIPQLGNVRTLLPANKSPMEFQDTSISHPCVQEERKDVSHTISILLLLVSTGLVALCAEFMVGSINAVVKKDSGLSEAFIGLIILPIVGNAAEHVTAVTVATKNKMDLAIGVAIGSSIQIALFVTPFVVLLGWCMGKELSLLFTLFETVSLFVSAFIVNFLVLDGRSNYLEGALLCAAYIMIAVAAFFYPSVQESSSLGGNDSSNEIIKRAWELVSDLS